MSKTISAATTYTQAVSFEDQFGNPIAAPAAGAISLVSSNPAVATVTYDGTNAVITPVAPGETTITAGGLTGSLDVTVAAPVASAIVFG